MLHEFITTYRDAITARAREKVTDRPWPLVSTSELEHGVPLFLTQLAETLRWETTPTPFAKDAIGASAVKHGRELRALGFNIAQVVHDYGDICQAITEVAVEQHVPITTEEFHLNTALLAFHTLKRGTVAINGSTGTVLGRSLIGLRDLVDSTLSDIRMTASIQQSARVPVGAFISEIAMVGNLHAEYRALDFVIEPVDPRMAVDADPQLLTSAVMNLLSNAFKYTHAGGRVVLRALREDTRVRIEVEDECGGLPGTADDPFRAFADRRRSDRTGLGLGLSIARKAVRMHGGDIHFRNLPGTGCVFVIELPLAGEETPVPQ
jgi:signal transduction histidine kinase